MMFKILATNLILKNTGDKQSTLWGLYSALWLLILSTGHRWFCSNKSKLQMCPGRKERGSSKHAEVLASSVDGICGYHARSGAIAHGHDCVPGSCGSARIFHTY